MLPLFGGAPEYLLNALQVQQLKAARFVCGYKSYYWSTKKLLNTCGWLYVKQQEFHSTTLLAHTIATTSLPHNIHSDMFQPYNVHTRAASQGQILYGVQYRGENVMKRGSFKYRAQQYNLTIPRDMKIKSLGISKSRLKKHANQEIPVR